jgi:predicted MFS family arabinose efflux permease
VLTPPEKRGRALSIVLGGQTVALILGVPLGTWIAFSFDWRMPFWIVGVVSVLAALFIRLFLPTIDSSDFVSLKGRLSLLNAL